MSIIILLFILKINLVTNYVFQNHFARDLFNLLHKLEVNLDPLSLNEFLQKKKITINFRLEYLTNDIIH